MFANDWTCRELAILAVLGFSALAVAHRALADPTADWAITPPAGTSRASNATFEVGLPADLTSAQIAHLGVEIDDIDVTAIAHIGGGKIVYTPPQPLASGAHRLRVVEYASDGRLTPRGTWRVTTGSAGKRTAAANLEGLYGSDNGVGSVGGQGLRPAQMQLALTHAKDSLILGDQTLQFDNLLISGLSRRGVSGHLANMPLRSDATAFSVRDSALAGFYGGLGIANANANDNVSGAILQSYPLAKSPRCGAQELVLIEATASQTVYPNAARSVLSLARTSAITEPGAWSCTHHRCWTKTMPYLPQALER